MLGFTHTPTHPGSAFNPRSNPLRAPPWCLGPCRLGRAQRRPAHVPTRGGGVPLHPPGTILGPMFEYTQKIRSLTFPPPRSGRTTLGQMSGPFLATCTRPCTLSRPVPSRKRLRGRHGGTAWGPNPHVAGMEALTLTWQAWGHDLEGRLRSTILVLRQRFESSVCHTRACEDISWAS